VPRCALDHIAVVASSLAAGAAFVETTLGVAPQPGGEHPRMGTHNRLLRLGASAYLEVIAANPAAPAPGRPRWFALDTLAPDASPRLAAWVARTPDIRASAVAASEALGAIEPMSRGALDWLITIPPDGALPLGGAAPALIEWHTDAHPATRLVDHGLALVALELHHPDPARIARLLASLDFDGPVTVVAADAPRLVARIATPHGIKTLG